MAKNITLMNGRYIIYSRFSGLAMDVEAISTSNGANVWQWQYLGGKNQQFDIEHVGDNYYSIRAAHSGKSLDVYDFSKEPGGEIRQYEYWGGDNQLWSIVSSGDGYFTIISKLSGLVLDVFERSEENGGDIRQWTKLGGLNQQWSLIPVVNDLSEDGYQSVPINQVWLKSGPLKQAQDLNILYLLRLDPERLLMPYRREAGIATSASSYPNWESDGLDGHIGGHYLTALSISYAATGNEKIHERLDTMINALEQVQNAHGDGYIGGIPGGRSHWNDLAAGTVSVGGFGLNNMWVPWYNLHKVFAGLRDAYLYTGNSKARSMLIKLSDWAINLTAGLSDDKMQSMLVCEHGGMNEVLADVYALTNNTKYLDAARRFSHKSILNPLLSGTDDLNGKHANTQIPKIIGYERIGSLASDSTWVDASKFFWNTVVNERSVTIGGNSVAEHFHDKNNFKSMVTNIEGPENCNTYNMMKLSRALYHHDGELRYIDYYERALFNHILSSQHNSHGGLVYFTPMRPDHYRVYSKHDECMWCCVGSGIENHGKYGEMIYAHKGDNFYINMFVASEVSWKNGINFSQETSFPDADSSTITVYGGGDFTLHIRYPGWVASGAMTMHLNGQQQSISASPGQYISISRDWQEGDSIELRFPMRTTAEQLPDGLNYYSIMHGPIVLAAETNPYPDETLDFIAGSARMDHSPREGTLAKLNESPILVGYDTDFLSEISPVADTPLTFTLSPSAYNKDTALTLKPFFRVHDSRYSVYFAQYTPKEWADVEEELKRKADEEAALAKRTIDQLQPGQQQPESDHYIESQDSNTGIHLDHYWRDAKGYFSYLLDPDGEASATLRVTYFGEDKDRNFDILINDTKLATVGLTGGRGKVFFDVDYNIPSSMISNGSAFRVKFQAHAGSVAGGVFYVRLLRNS
ncbi:MAG: glycoside hydrolase family 127 protein [Reinekea sp.]